MDAIANSGKKSLQGEKPNTGDLANPVDVHVSRRKQIFEKGIDINNIHRRNITNQDTNGINREELRTLAIGALRQFFFMGEEVFERMDLVLDSLRCEHLAAGEYLMRQGEEGNKMYIIQSGSLEVDIDNKLVRVIGAGDAVGELALLFNAPRSASVKAQAPCVLWSLKRETFREVQALASSAQLVQRVAWLLQAPSLQGLDKVDLCKLASSLRTIPMRNGEIIINEGQRTDRLVLVESGVVEVVSSQLSTRAEKERAVQVTPPKEDEGRVAIGTPPRGRNSNAGSGSQSTRARSQPPPGFSEAQGSNNATRRNSADHIRSRAGSTGDVNELTFGSGCFLGKPMLLAAAGMVDPDTKWEVAADQSGRFHGVVPPVTFRARGEVRCSYCTIPEFEGLVGNVSKVLDEQKGIKDERRRSVTVSHVTANYPRKKPKMQDFKTVAHLGTGSFGRVTLVQARTQLEGEPKSYALKAVSKVAVIEGGQLEHLQDERQLLMSLEHPFILSLYTTFQDRDFVYFLTESVLGGELWSVIYEGVSMSDPSMAGYGLPVDQARFYAATVIEALGFMHFKGVAYRDLKPENLMIDDLGYLRVIDLGFAKKVPFVTEDEGRIQVFPKTYTMCGTPEYLAPEFIFNKGHDHSVDYWAFGVLTFELVAGHTPFVPPEGYSNMTELFTAIACSKRQGIPFPDDFDRKARGKDCRDLVIKLLQSEPSHRLGNLAGRTDDIKDHPFFKGYIDYAALYERQITAPWVPAPRKFDSPGANDGSQEMLIFFGNQDQFSEF